MNILELLTSLNESTYDTKKIEDYYNHIVSKLRPGDLAVDLTKSFHERFPEITRSSMLILKLKDVKPKSLSDKTPTQEFQKAPPGEWGKTSVYNRRTEKGTRTPTAVLSIWIDREQNKEKFKNTFIHEFTHVLDGLRTYSRKRHLPTIRGPNPSENYLGYRIGTFEFNQAINMIKRYKDGAYDKLNNVDDVVRWFFQRASGASMTGRETIATKAFETASKNPEFRKQLLKRLARENLLPKSLKV